MKRANFSAKTKQLARERANHTCELAGCEEPANEVDHIKACWQGGENTLENAQALCRKHHARKTAKDCAVRAKCDRAAGRKGQYARRKKAKAEGRYKPIGGGGFNKKLKRKFDGTVVAREQESDDVTDVTAQEDLSIALATMGGVRRNYD